MRHAIKAVGQCGDGGLGLAGFLQLLGFPRGTLGLGYCLSLLPLALEALLLDRSMPQRSGSLAHGPDFVGSRLEWHSRCVVAPGQVAQVLGQDDDRRRNVPFQHDDRQAEGEKHQARSAVHDGFEHRFLCVGSGLHVSCESVGLLDHTIDDRAMRCIVGSELLVKGAFSSLHIVAFECGKERLLEFGPELRGLCNGGLGQGVPQLCWDQRRGLPDSLAIVEVLAQLGKPRLARLHFLGPIQGQSRLKIGFHDVERRRQDVGDQVLSSNDPLIIRAAHTQLIERVAAEADGQRLETDQSETNHHDRACNCPPHCGVPPKKNRYCVAERVLVVDLP